MNRKKRIILTLSLSLLIFISICLSVGLIKQRQKNTNEVYIENIKTNNNSSVFAIMLETEAGSGIYEKSNTSLWPGEGYVFNEQMSTCENGSKLSWNEELGAVTLSTGIADRCFVYFDKEPDIIYLADYIKNTVYQGDGVNGLYYHDGVGTYTNADQEAGDNSYRYAGANPNNYVCFGSDDEICPEDSLYRIIGIFDENGTYQVKLIKASAATVTELGTNGAYINGYYKYSSLSSCDNSLSMVSNVSKINNIIAAPDPVIGGCNKWEMSDLNLINLNQNYINSLSNSWENLIANHNWLISSFSVDTLNTTVSNKDIYNSEINNTTSISSAKIGLMYINDFRYANLPEYWKQALLSINNTLKMDDNWMFIKISEWIITADTSNHGYGYFGNISNIILDGKANLNGQLYDGGSIIYSTVHFNANARPVFYLNSDVTYVSGDGSQENPFRIE